MLEKLKSDIRVTYPSTAGNMAVEAVQFLLMAGGLLFHFWKMPSVIGNACFGLLALMWGVSYVRFRRDAGIGLVKCCSLQLITCGLLGAGLVSLFNQCLTKGAYQAGLILLVLLTVVVGIHVYCFREKRTAWVVTFLMFPYCVLCVDFFLITGFLSAILLMIAFFSGTLVFEHQKMEDEEYFGNSGGRF